MKGLIVEKRAKQLIALCLVILQVCFQFPIQWKVEGVTQKNNEKELHFLFKDENGQASKGTNVLVKLSIYKAKNFCHESQNLQILITTAFALLHSLPIFLPNPP